jgi:hypothetical protein
MDEETHARIAERLELCEIRYNIVESRRTKTIDMITTLTDAHEYSKEDPADAKVTRKVAGGIAEAVYLSMFPGTHETGATRRFKAARICALETSRSM